MSDLIDSIFIMIREYTRQGAYHKPWNYKYHNTKVTIFRLIIVNCLSLIYVIAVSITLFSPKERLNTWGMSGLT